MTNIDDDIVEKSIIELLNENKINNRVYNILEDADINTLAEIIKYYNENLNFFMIRNVGKKANSDLIALVNEYSNLLPEMEMIKSNDVNENKKQIKKNSELKKITIFRLLKEGRIDVRTHNVLNNAKIYNVYDIIDYYLRFKRFDNLKNAGRRTNEYLMKIVKENHNKRFLGQEFYTETVLEKIETNNLEVNPKIKVESLDEYEQLSNRTKNIIKYEDLETIKKLIEYYTEKRNFLDVRNCGKKSNNELIKLSKRIIDKLEKDDESLSGIQDEYIDFMHDIENTFGINIFPIKTINRQYLDKNIETFFLIKLLASSYLSIRDYSVFILLNKFSEGFSKPTLHEIGNSLKISRERVRQIINNGIQNFNESFIKLINGNDSYRLFFKKYFTEYKDIVVIDDVFTDNINKTENCDFSKNYIGYILTQFLSKDYFNFCIDNNSTKNNEYLIKKDLESAINLKELFKKISIKIQTLKTIIIDVESIVQQIANECDDEVFARLVKIIEKIVKEEYNLPYDENKRVFYYAR